MDKQTILDVLRRHEQELRATGVSGLSLFGSFAAGTARSDSDIDIFIDYNRPDFSLFELMEIERKIKKLLGVNIDLMTRGSIHPLLRKDIEISAEKVF